MTLNREQSVFQVQFTKSDIKHLEVVTGLSPNAMRRVFGGWILFVAAVTTIIAVAPTLSQNFITITVFVLVSFTLVIFWQSRIAEGWPSVILLDNAVGVVSDPQQRRFICASLTVVKEARPAVIKPNKRAVEILLDENQLSEQDKHVLAEAVWPRDDRLLGLCHFSSPDIVSTRVNQALR